MCIGQTACVRRNTVRAFVDTSEAYHPLFVLRTCASCILMAASVVNKGFCDFCLFVCLFVHLKAPGRNCEYIFI